MVGGRWGQRKHYFNPVLGLTHGLVLPRFGGRKISMPLVTSVAAAVASALASLNQAFYPASNATNMEACQNLTSPNHFAGLDPWDMSAVQVAIYAMADRRNLPIRAG